MSDDGFMRKMKSEINSALNLSMLVGLSPELRDKPDVAAEIREEQRRFLRNRVYATENQKLIAYFEESLADVKANEEKFREKIAKGNE
jgi:hypothetical protein